MRGVVYGNQQIFVVGMEKLRINIIEAECCLQFLVGVLICIRIYRQKVWGHDRFTLNYSALKRKKHIFLKRPDK